MQKIDVSQPLDNLLQKSASDKLNSIHQFTFDKAIRDKLHSLMWTSDEIQYIEKLVSKLSTIPGCYKIWLYGSMARGDQDSNPNKKSDIDLAIEIEEGVYSEDMFRKDIRDNGLRPIQLNFFPMGYDERTRDALRPEHVVDFFDEETGDYTVKYLVDYVTVRSSQDAAKRLSDQIVLWQKV